MGKAPFARPALGGGEQRPGDAAAAMVRLDPDSFEKGGRAGGQPSATLRTDTSAKPTRPPSASATSVT